MRSALGLRSVSLVGLTGLLWAHVDTCLQRPPSNWKSPWTGDFLHNWELYTIFTVIIIVGLAPLCGKGRTFIGRMSICVGLIVLSLIICDVWVRPPNTLWRDPYACFTTHIFGLALSAVLALIGSYFISQHKVAQVEDSSRSAHDLRSILGVYFTTFGRGHRGGEPAEAAVARGGEAVPTAARCAVADRTAIAAGSATGSSHQNVNRT
jgi:hypothetical protein